MNAYQPTEASIKDAESSLVIRDLNKALYVTIVVGTHNPVSVGINLVDAAWRHLQTDRLPCVTPVVLVAVVTLFQHISRNVNLYYRLYIQHHVCLSVAQYIPCRLSFLLKILF